MITIYAFMGKWQLVLTSIFDNPHISTVVKVMSYLASVRKHLVPGIGRDCRHRSLLASATAPEKHLALGTWHLALA